MTKKHKFFVIEREDNFKPVKLKIIKAEDRGIAYGIYNTKIKKCSDIWILDEKELQNLSWSLMEAYFKGKRTDRKGKKGKQRR